MRAADRRGLLRAPVTVALQTAITQKKEKTLSRTSLHHPRRTPPRFESRLAPLLRRGQGLRTVGVDSRSSSWWNGDRQTSPGPITKTSFSYSVYLLESARHAPSMEAHRASVVAIRPAARKRTRKGYLRLNNSCFIVLTASKTLVHELHEREMR